MVRIQPFVLLKRAFVALVALTVLATVSPAQATRPTRSANSVPEIDGTTARAALTLLFLGTLILSPVRRAVRPASDEA